MNFISCLYIALITTVNKNCLFKYAYFFLINVFIGVLTLFSHNVYGQCVNPYFENVSQLKNKSSKSSAIYSTPSRDLYEVYADNVHGKKNENWTAKGNVVIHQMGSTFFTDYANGDFTTNIISIPSSFNAIKNKSLISAKEGQYSSLDKSFSAHEGEFISEPFDYTYNYLGILSNRSANKQISFRANFANLSTPSENEGLFEDVLLTTCPPDNQQWGINASSLSVYDEEQLGVARNVTLRIGGVPIFYLPYIDFPLDGRRKSGFIFPTIEFSEVKNGNGDNESIINFTLPYYFNLAPNYDWMLYAKPISKRGILYNNDFRYLSENSSGNIKVNGIPNDSLYIPTNFEYNQKRYRLYWSHNHIINSNLSFSLLGNRVSDTQYLKDFSDSVYPNTTIHLPNEFRLKANYQGWSSQIAYVNYQTLTKFPSRDKPFIRSPQINFSSPNYQLSYSNSGFGSSFAKVEGEATVFTHNINTNINRAWVYPKINWQLNSVAGFLGFQVGGHLSRYKLINPNTSENSVYYRALPIIKSTGGLIFERELADNAGWLQTLEPSLHWLYIPYNNQNNLPVIDTSRLTFQLSQLNIDNLFSGWDRIADANVVTYEINNRILDPNGREKFNLRFGQRKFLTSSQVILPGETTTPNNTSDFLLSANALLDKWRIEAGMRYSSDEEIVTNREVLISYQPQNDRLIGARYIFQKKPVLPANTLLQKEILSKVNTQELIEGVIDWPLRDYISQNISFTGRNYYSVADKAILESQVALRYDSCCMSVSLYRTNVLIDNKETYEQKWGLEFNLYGFGNIRSKSNKELDTALRSFRVY